MRKYEKPVMQVERFVPNTNIAKGCGYQTVTSSTRVTVYCMVGKQMEGSTGEVVTYNGTSYWVWYDSDANGSGKPDSTATANLTAICRAGGLIGKNEDAEGWHGGEIKYNSSTNEVYISQNS